MKIKYVDILSRIKEEPSWWDDNGHPRYGEFKPNLAPNIYAKEVALFLIACQACGKEFQVTRTWEQFEDAPPLSTEIPRLYYGDPPNIGCCPAGPTMSSDSIRVLEFWTKNWNGWSRRPELEVDLED